MAKETVESNKTTEKNFQIREAIKSAVSKMPNATIEEKKEHAKVLVKIFEKEMTPKQAMSISDEDISVIYSYAYQLFNNGKYTEACELFKMLYVLDPNEGGFASGLGACYHKLGDYETAFLMYMIHAQTAPFDPVPVFYCYDCLIRMNNPEGAYMMLNETLLRTLDQPQYEKLQDKAEALLANFDLSTLTEVTESMKEEENAEDEE